MATILVAPEPFTVLSANQSATAPAANMNRDTGGMVWRSVDLNAPAVTIRCFQPYDTIALVGSNLRAGDQVRIRTGISLPRVNGDLPPTADMTVTAWTGSAPTGGAITYVTVPLSSTNTYLRLDITATDHPDDYVQAQRLVVGKRVVTDGVNVGAEQTFEDMSSIEEGLGYTTVDEYGVRIGWKVTLEGIRDADYNGNWFPFLRNVGRKKAFVFIPDDTSSYVQTQAIFGRITSTARGTSPVADYNNVELSLLSVN